MAVITDQEGHTPVVGFTVYDTILIMHLIEKLLRGGGVTGKEVSFVAQLRDKAIKSADAAVGFDIETLLSPAKTTTTNNTQGG